jgi:hypothetical protein
MKMQYFDLEKRDQKRISTIGRCIYCGGNDGDLRDEHVIPYALAANTVIFEQASCETCQNIIQKYEQRVLRGQLGVFRAQIDAPTRNKKNRLTHKTVRFCEVDDDGKVVRDLGEKQIPIGDAPLAFSVWELPPPGILEEQVDDTLRVGRPWTYVQRRAFADAISRDLARESGSKNVAFKIDDINRDDFLRFLAKTAHAYAIYEVGAEAFRALAVDLILRRNDDLVRLIGGETEQSPNETHPATTSEFGIGRIINGPAAGYTAVRIRLYPFLGTPAHIVIVGAPL